MQLSDSMQLTKEVFQLVFSTFKVRKHVRFVNKIQILKKCFTTFVIIKKNHSTKQFYGGNGVYIRKRAKDYNSVLVSLLGHMHLFVIVDIGKFVRYEILLTFYSLVSFARCLQQKQWTRLSQRIHRELGRCGKDRHWYVSNP